MPFFTAPIPPRPHRTVTGHYDSRNSDNFNTHDPAPGANDDASGTAVSIESARVLSKMKFPSTIIFLTVAGEEQGLDGSRHIAKLAKSEGWDLEAVLNNDIVGGDTTPGATGADKSAVRVFSEGAPGPPPSNSFIQTIGAENDSPARELARAIVDVGNTYFHPSSQRLSANTPANQPHSMAMRMVPAFHPVMIFRRDRFGRGGDHTSFSNEGFAAVRFTEWLENFNHQHQTPRVENGVEYADDIKYDDFEYIANVARLNSATRHACVRARSAKEGRRRILRMTREPSSVGKNLRASRMAPRSRSSTAILTSQTGRRLPAPTLTLPAHSRGDYRDLRSVLLDAAGHRSAAVYPIPPPRTRPVPGTTPAPAPTSN